MKHAEECEFEHLLADGTPVVRLRGDLHEIAIHGVEIPQPPPQAYVELMTRRLPRLGKPLRCIVNSVDPTGRTDATVLCYGWQDKSGDVWLDLAVVLLEEGLARTLSAGFSEREQYLRHEQQARVRGAGIWGSGFEKEQEE